MPNVSTRLRKGKGARFKPPRTSQDAVPVRRVWPDGVFLTDDRRFAKTWRVSDVNYAAASKEDKEAMFLDYSGLLNSFDSDAQTKITVAVRRLDAEAFGRSALIPRKDEILKNLWESYHARTTASTATGTRSTACSWRRRPVPTPWCGRFT